MHVDPSAPNATVTGAIRQAARVTGTDFQYLLATAQVESNLNPNAKVATSSARGLYQFIEQTWLQTLKQQGPALGYGRYADAIARLPSGKYVVTEPRLHGAIMSLRSDPTASAVMAGAFTRTNAERLAGALGRDPTEGELYIAHFLGSSGASRLIELAQSRPTASAAEAFPGAAKSNRSIFYDRAGRDRSASEVYRSLVGRYQVARDGRKAPATTVAAMDLPSLDPVTMDDPKADQVARIERAAAAAMSATVVARTPPVRLQPVALDRAYPATPATAGRMASEAAPIARANDVPVRVRTVALDRVGLADRYEPYATAPPSAAAQETVAAPETPARRRALALAPEVSANAYVPEAAQPASAARETPSPAVARSPEAGPIFHGLFRTAGADEPVAPLVNALWTAPAKPPASKPAAEPGAPAEPGVPQTESGSGPLDLLQDLVPSARALYRGRG